MLAERSDAAAAAAAATVPSGWQGNTRVSLIDADIDKAYVTRLSTATLRPQRQARRQAQSARAHRLPRLLQATGRGKSAAWACAQVPVQGLHTVKASSLWGELDAATHAALQSVPLPTSAHVRAALHCACLWSCYRQHHDAYHSSSFACQLQASCDLQVLVFPCTECTVTPAPLH